MRCENVSVLVKKNETHFYLPLLSFNNMFWIILMCIAFSIINDSIFTQWLIGTEQKLDNHTSIANFMKRKFALFRLYENESCNWVGKSTCAMHVYIININHTLSFHILYLLAIRGPPRTNPVITVIIIDNAVFFMIIPLNLYHL